MHNNDWWQFYKIIKNLSIFRGVFFLDALCYNDRKKYDIDKLPVELFCFITQNLAQDKIERERQEQYS